MHIVTETIPKKQLSFLDNTERNFVQYLKQKKKNRNLTNDDKLVSAVVERKSS